MRVLQALDLVQARSPAVTFRVCVELKERLQGVAPWALARALALTAPEATSAARGGLPWGDAVAAGDTSYREVAALFHKAAAEHMSEDWGQVRQQHGAVARATYMRYIYAHVCLCHATRVLPDMLCTCSTVVVIGNKRCA